MFWPANPMNHETEFFFIGESEEVTWSQVNVILFDIICMFSGQSLHNRILKHEAPLSASFKSDKQN